MVRLISSQCVCKVKNKKLNRYERNCMNLTFKLVKKELITTRKDFSCCTSYTSHAFNLFTLNKFLIKRKRRVVISTNCIAHIWLCFLFVYQFHFRFYSSHFTPIFSFSTRTWKKTSYRSERQDNVNVFTSMSEWVTEEGMDRRRKYLCDNY